MSKSNSGYMQWPRIQPDCFRQFRLGNDKDHLGMGLNKREQWEGRAWVSHLSRKIYKQFIESKKQKIRNQNVKASTDRHQLKRIEESLLVPTENTETISLSYLLFCVIDQNRASHSKEKGF